MARPAVAAVDEPLPAQDPDLAGPPPWLVVDEEPADLPPLPPDPLGPHPFAADADSPEAVDATSGVGTSELLNLLAPGPGLAAELEDTDTRSLDLYELVEAIAGYHRVASWAHARVTELAGQLTARPGINPHHPLPGGKLAADAAAAEIGPRLGIPRRTARRIVGNAALFRGKLDQTAAALRRGHIDPVKADTLARMLADQPTDVAWEVQQLVLPGAAHQTANQLSRAVQKALIAVDPHRATQRHRQARDARRVDHPRPLPDGMAGLYAVLPATDAAGLDLALEAAARSAKAAGDTRTIDQLRADALALLGHAALEQGYIGLPEGYARPPGIPDAGASAPGDPDARPGTSGEPDAPTGTPGEPDAPTGAAGEPDANPGTPSEPDAPTGAAGEPDANPGTPSEPDASTGAAGEPEPGPDTTDGSGSGDGFPDAPTAAGGTPDLQPVSDYLRMLHMPVGTIGGRRAQIRLTVPLSVLVLPPESQGGFANLGECLAHLTGEADNAPGDGSAVDSGAGEAVLEPARGSSAPEAAAESSAHRRSQESSALGRAQDSSADGPAADGRGSPGGCACRRGETTPEGTLALAEVAELDGYGFVTPDVARALAMSGGTWQRLVTDPLSGALLDVGRTRYRPPAAMAEFVRARDRMCIVPNCSTPAYSCDLDHVVRYPDAPTSAFNLGPLCGPDHDVKTMGSFELRHLGGGTFEWTTPSGHVYRRDHHGRVTWVQRGAVETPVTPPPF